MPTNLLSQASSVDGVLPQERRLPATVRRHHKSGFRTQRSEPPAHCGCQLPPSLLSEGVTQEECQVQTTLMAGVGNKCWNVNHFCSPGLLLLQ
jgi:hypothetical protein